MLYVNEKVFFGGEGDYNGCYVCLVFDGKIYGKLILFLS